MKKTWALLLPLFVSFQLFATTLVSDSILLNFSKTQVDSLYTANGVPAFLFPTQYAVNVHRVIYNTLDGKNQPTIASGLIIVPVGDTCPVPLISYQHGTQSKKDQVFSYLKGEWIVGVAGAATGYLACLPDYIGLGFSPGIHPYQHAETEARAVIDMLRAAREIAAREGLNLSDELFLLGYSQGGHATMAAHREIEENLEAEFTVTASAPLSGAYDMSGVQFDMVASFDPYSVPGYLPFLILGYQDVYGNLYNDISEIFAAPYDSILPPLFDGNYTINDVNAVMPSVPRLIIDSTYAAAFFSDPQHPALLALKDNDVYDWVPVAPVRMGYCDLDEEVSFLNAFVARDTMQARGATSVEAISRSSTLGHFECAQPSILLSKFWFDSLSVNSTFCHTTGIFSPDFKNTEMSIFPNPASEETQISFSNKEQNNYSVFIATTAGNIVNTIRNVADEKVVVDTRNLSSGIYIVLIHSEKKSYWGKLVKE
jgi:pimeloyl-ACP methyl ester carboxylesterase